MEIQCPHCGRRGRLPEGGLTPATVRCPHCKTAFPTNASAAPSGVAVAGGQVVGSATIFCPRCGQQNHENHFKCTGCGCVLHGSQPASYVAADDGTMGGLVPYKNSPAIWAYYLAVFSLIPCAGIPLGIAALVLGIRGLKHARFRPQDKGQAHAWTGIILGGLCAAGYSLLIVVPILMAVMSR
jgi:hypothetical protein